MKEFIAVIALGLAHYPLIATAQSQSAATSSGSSSGAASDLDYLNSVCSPDVGSNDSILPPCVSVENIESACQPKGKTPADYAASAECICKKPSSYFDDWVGCRKCLEVHGGFSELQYNAYVLQASAASKGYCQGTPTGSIADAFAHAQVDGTPTGNTVVSDQFPSQTAVSLYYKPSEAQGPGISQPAGGKDSGDASATGFPTGSVTGMVTADSGSGSQTTGAAGGSGSTKTGGSASPSSSSKSAARANAPLTALASLGLIGFVAALVAL